MTTSGTDISLSSLAAAAAVAASRDEDDAIIDERVREESDGKAPVVEKRSASGSEDDEADEDEEDEETNNKSGKSKSSNPKQQQQSSSNKARGATYDGNLCMICSDRASGFHYGVLACEGCKGFFKRVCKEQLKQVANGGNDELTSKDGQQQQSKRHCVFGGNCEINMRTRNRCQYCRIQKCLELGMSKDGIKLGRRSKKFKQNLSHVVAAAATPTQQPLVKQETSKTVPSSNKTATTKKSSPSPILNQEEPKQPQQQILAILPDNKFIIKAIDILSAVSAVAASASTTTTPVVANSSSPVATANQQQLVLANNLNILNNGHQTAGSNNLVNDSTVNASNVNSLTSAQLLAHQLVINNSNSNNSSSNNIKQQSDANNNSLKFVKIEQNGNLIDQNLNGGNVIVLSSQSSDQLKASISNGATMCSGVAASSSSAANTANATQAPIIVLNSFNLATAPSNITNHNHNQLNPANLINSFVILNNNPNGEAIGNSSPQLQQQELQPIKQQKISIYSMLDKTQLNNIIEAITQAHKDTDTMYNHEPTLSALISSPSAATTSSAQQQQHQASELLRAVLERGLIALLTQTRLLDHINMLIEQAVLFAKNVPYFMNIHESDRIALLKSCVFDVICVRHATFFRTSLASRCSASLSSSSTSSSPFSSSASSSSSDENNTSSSSIDLATLAACAVAASSTNHPHNGHQNQQLQLQGRLFIPLWNVWLNQETLTHSLPQLARFIAMLFDFYAYFNSIGPNDYELAIFSSYLLFNTDDQTLNDKEKLYSYHSLFHDIVLNEMLKSRSSELGREVNSSSSNSLCKPMSRDELELWMKTCCMKLKRLNQEHAKILMEQKQFIQFPDLYAELYNL